MTNPDEHDAQASAPPVAVSPSARMLLRIVYIMGIILVLLFMTLVGGIIWKSTRKSGPAPNPAAASLNLALPPGSEIRAVAIDGDRLVINTGQQVIVVDVKKNAVISRILTGP